MSDTTPIRVLLVDTEFNTHNRYLALSIRDALARHGSVGEVILADYSNVVRHAQTGVFDLFLAFGGGGGGSDHVILHRAASFCRFRMLWTTDDPYTVEENVEVSVGYDLVATNDFASIGRYDRAMHLPLAAAPEWCWHEVQNDQKDILYDVLFLGNPWPNRVNVLSKLVSALGDEMRFKIGLPSNEFIPSYELPGFDGAETNWRASLIDFCRFANRSKVVLTLPRSFTASRGGQPSAVTPGPRLFETALAGTCQLIQQSGEDVSRYFNPDTEIATFSDPEEGIESLRRLVKNPDLRHTMAKSSQMKALSNHTYDHRVNSLISAMTEWQRQNPVCLSSSPLQNSTAQNKEPERSITRNILFVTHNMVGHSNWGGVEIYQQQMADELKLHKFATYILFPRSDQAGRQYLSLIAPDGTQTDFETSPQNYSRYIRFPQHELIFANILSDFDIELVHMQHLINHVMGLPIIARAFGVPVVYTLHDYYIMCDDPGLFGYDEQHCYIYDRSAEQCEICLPAMRGVPAASQTRRKKAMRRSLAAIDAFIASTPRSLEHVLSFYPEIKQRSSIIPMAFQGTNAHIDTRRSMPSTVNEGTLRVLIPGNFTKHKGARALITMMRSLASEDIYFRVIGRVDEPFKTEVHELNLPNAEFVGPYRQEEFALLAEGFDVSIHYSVWPETYCITLSESLSAGLVPIVSDIGAFSDRIQHGENGLTVQVGDVGAIARHLRALAADRTRLDELRRGHDAAHLCSVRDHASALALLYNNLLDRFPAHGRSKGEPQLSRAVRLTVEKVDPQQVNHPRWDTDEIIWERAPPAPLNVKLLERGATPLSGRAKYVISRFCGLEMPTQHARVTICDGQRFSIEGELRDFSRAERVSAEIEFEGITVIRVGCSLVRNSTATFLFTLDAATRALPEGDYSLRLVICADERTVVTDLELNVTIAHALQPRPVRFDRTGSPLSVRKGARVGVGWDALQLDDGFLQETSSSIAIRGRKIFVRGWAVDISTARRVRRYYLSFFDNRTGDEYIVSCEPRHRPDILNLYGSKEFEFSGFEFSLEGNVLPEGEYSLSLLGRVGDGLVEWDSGRRFEVLDAVMSFPSPVSQGKEYASFATSKILPDILTVCGHLAQAPGDMFVAERYLEVAGEWPLSQGQDSWPSIEILLEGAQSWLARAERRFRMSKTRTKVGSIRFSAVIPVARLPIETFALRIIVRNGEHREVTPILCRVSGSAGVVSDGVHFLDGRAATDDLLACGCLDVFGPHTSVGLPLEDKGLEVASGEIDIRGWIDLKVPDAEIASKRLHLLVSSADGRRVATAWLHRVARHDVYDILNKDETSVIGFEGRMHLPADFQSAELTLVVGGGLAAVKLPLVTSARLSTRLASRMG